jgi:hypothetical protein
MITISWEKVNNYIVRYAYFCGYTIAAHFILKNNASKKIVPGWKNFQLFRKNVQIMGKSEKKVRKFLLQYER